MIKNLISIATILVLFSSPGYSQLKLADKTPLYKNKTIAVDRRVEDLLERMT